MSVNHGSTVSFTFNADPGYHVAAVSGCAGSAYVNTTNAVGSHTYTTGAITGDCTVTATFAINTYTVSASAGVNGSLAGSTPSPVTVNHGSTTSFTFNADTGYHVSFISGCGVSHINEDQSVTSKSVTTASITNDCTVSSTFTVNRYQLSISAEGYGTVISDSGGINCPDVCTGQYDYGTIIGKMRTPVEELVRF